jgi:AraC-like DNA-binding protein
VATQLSSLNKVIRMRTFTARAVTTSLIAPTRTDIPRTPRLNREQREAWVMALYLGGATVEEIAFVLGGARTAIRQCVMDCGLARHRGARNIDVLAIMREVRLTGTLTLKEVAARLTYSEETIRHSIAALGMTESVRRLFRLRRRAARRAAAANTDLAIATVAVRALATRRTPAVRVA